MIEIGQVRVELATQGFVHLRSIFPTSAIERIRLDAKRVFTAQLRAVGLAAVDPADEVAFSRVMFELYERDRPSFIGAAKLCQNLVSMHKLSLSDEAMALVAAAGLGFPTISTRPTMFFNSRHLAESDGYWRTPAHQDWRSMQGSLNSIVIWVPLLDIDRDLGTLEVAAGSHRLGLLDTTEDDFYRAIDAEAQDDVRFSPVEVSLGDCLIFSSFLVHRSGNNVTERIRWSCHFRYNDMEEPTFIKRRFPNPYLYRPQQELISPGFPTIEDLRQTFPLAASINP